MKQRLGVDHIDLFYQHRVDGTIPNMKLVDRVKEIAEAKRATLGQVALAWLLHRRQPLKLTDDIDTFRCSAVVRLRNSRLELLGNNTDHSVNHLVLNHLQS
jgi:hypothetical protein